MEVEYKREMNRNYMVLRPEPGHVDRYTIRMISGNQIGGLLPFREKWMNGENQYYYDITSKQPMERILEFRRLNGEELYDFWTGFLNAMGQMERFLLDESQICLDPEYIYVDPESFQCALLIIPGKYMEFTEGFRRLCQYLLDHVNQNDGDAVILGFSVFKESQKPNFGMDDIEHCLEKRKKREKICAEQTELKKEENEKSKEERETEVGINREQTMGLGLPVQSKEEDIPELQEEKTRNVHSQLAGILIAAIALLIPMIVVFVGGMALLLQYRLYILGAEVLLISGAVLFNRSETVRLIPDSTKTSDDQPILNEDYFAQNKDLWKEEPKSEIAEESPQTILLTAKPVGGTSRYLVPVGGGEEIPVRYFPFLIGKNRSIVDFYLNEPGVSRIHAKLEESEGNYYVTDLNSTNGIMVDGAWLETNEKRLLPLGSELVLAASRFYFR